MGLKKPNAHRPLVNGGGFQRKRSIVNGGGSGSQRKSTEPIDNWDFLEEIEAPMWVDLTLESKSMDQDIDDKWFQVAHPFLQCPSRHLVSAFSVSSGRNTNSNDDLIGPSSPKLRLSVSRSRGKHYRRRKWRGSGHVVFVGKQHPISVFAGKTPQVVSGSGQEVKHKTSSVYTKQSSSLQVRLPGERRPNSLKTKPSFRNPKSASSSKASLVGKSNSTETMRPSSPRTKPSFRNPKSSSSSKASLVGESNSTETMRPNSPRAKHSFVDSESTLTSNARSVVESNSTLSSGPDSLKTKSSLGDSRSSYTRRHNSPKTKPRFGDSECTSSLHENFIGESNSISFNESDSQKHKSSIGDSKISSNSNASTVTDSNQQEQQIFGHKSGFLSAVRISLRKSCVTRQASRVEVKEKRQSKGHKSSSSSKSSVGSSTNSGCNLKNTMLTATTNKNRTPECREVVKLNQSTNEVKGTNVSKTSTGRFMDLNSDSKREGKAVAVKSVHQETSKSKVLHQSQPRKPSWLRNVQEPFNVGLKIKERVANSRKMNAVKKASGKENIVGSMVLSQKASKNGFEVKDDKGLSDPKDKANGRNKGKNPKNVVQRVYLR